MMSWHGSTAPLPAEIRNRRPGPIANVERAEFPVRISPDAPGRSLFRAPRIAAVASGIGSWTHEAGADRMMVSLAQAQAASAIRSL